MLSSLPTLELCDAAVTFGTSGAAPVALDVRDLWPDVLIDVMPAAARPFARVATIGMTGALRRSAAGATAILGVTDEFVDWGIAAAGRERTPRDRAFPMAYTIERPSDSAMRNADEFWRARGITPSSTHSVVCFFGTLGWMFDFDTVFAAARLLRDAAPDVLFVICGGGSSADGMRRTANALGNVLMTGRVGGAEIRSLMAYAIAGLAPYRPFRNFDDNVANKPVEYLSAGLPVIASRVRVLARLLDEARCGVTYAHGDARALADAVIRIARHPDERRSMSERAARLFEERFVAERVYADMTTHLESLARV